MVEKKKKFQCRINKNDISLLHNTSVRDFIHDVCGGEIEIIDTKKTEELKNDNIELNQITGSNHLTKKQSKWNNRKEKISHKIRYLLNKNREKIEKQISCISEDKEFFLQLIKNMFLFLKNTTSLLNHLNSEQFKAIPPLIYHIVKDYFSISRLSFSENEFLAKIKNLYGFIYLSTNSLNEKVYVGQTALPRTIEREWGDLISQGKRLRKKREENPNQKIEARHILNAIAKYDEGVWSLKLIDIAFSRSELNEKETYFIMEKFDSMNREKGYNMTEGGEGGRLSPEVIKKISKSSEKMWEDPDFKRKMMKSRQTTHTTPEFRKKQSEKSKKLWQRSDYREDHKKSRSEGQKKRWEKINPEFRYPKALREKNEERRIEIPSIKRFLTDIKYSSKQEVVAKKYKIKDVSTFNRKVEEILGSFEIKNYTKANRFLQDRDLDEILKYLDNPEEYNTFKDPTIKDFFKDVQNSEKVSDLFVKYGYTSYKGINNKINRIMGVFGIKNYMELKRFLNGKDIEDISKYIEDLNGEIIVPTLKQRIFDLIKEHYSLTNRQLYDLFPNDNKNSIKTYANEARIVVYERENNHW